MYPGYIRIRTRGVFASLTITFDKTIITTIIFNHSKFIVLNITIDCYHWLTFDCINIGFSLTYVFWTFVVNKLLGHLKPAQVICLFTGVANIGENLVHISWSKVYSEQTKNANPQQKFKNKYRNYLLVILKHSLTHYFLSFA